MVNIYRLIHPETMDVRYVGKTNESLNKRLGKHLYNKGNNAPINKWIRKLLKLDMKPIIELIEEVSDQTWEDKEIYWIKYYNDKDCKLLNISPGGDSGSLGYKHTDEAKAKISKANSRPKSKEWINNAANATRKATSVAIIQVDLDGNILKRWDSFCYAAKEIRPGNYTSAIKNIHACCNGKRKTAYKFIWRYENAELEDKEPLG